MSNFSPDSFHRDEKPCVLEAAAPTTSSTRGAGDTVEALSSQLKRCEIANARLEQQARLFDITINSIGDFAYIFDREGRFIYANQPLLDLLHVTLEKIVGRNFFDLHYPPALAARLQRQIDRVLESGETVRDETLIVAPGGKSGFYEYIFTPVLESDGSINRVAGSTRDVTERKRREMGAAFLADISQKLTLWGDTDETLRELAAIVGEFCALSRCAFIEMNESQDQATVLVDWQRDDIPALVGVYQVSDFLSEEFQNAGRAGETFVVRDVFADARTDAARYSALQIASFVSVPLVRDGQWRFLMAVYDSQPRDWRDEEIEILREATARIWTRLERAHAENALRASEARFRNLIGKGADMITVTNREGRIVYASPTTERVSSYTPEEFVTQNPFDFIHTDDIERCQDAFQALLETPNLSLNLQHRVRHRDGSWHWIEGTFTSLLHDETVGGIVANVHDITERKEAEDALRASQERLRIALDGAEMGAWNWNVLTDKVMWNDQHYRLFGLEPRREELDLSDFLAFVLHQDRAFLEAKLRLAAQETGVYDAEFQIRRADSGEVRWMSGYGRVVEQQNGRATLMSGVMYDSTARKTADDALRRAREELEDRVLERTQQLAEYAQTLEAQAALLELAHDAIIVCDRHRIITFWNHGAQQLYGWSAQESLGQNLHEWLSTQFPQPVEEIERRAQTQGRWEGELRHLCRNGREVVVQSRWAVQRDAAGDVVSTLEINTDITSRKEAEAVQRQLMKRLVDAQEDERKRISRELHDQMGQSLTALMLGLKALPDFGDAGFSPPSPNERIDQLQRLTQDLTQQVHRMAWELRPAVLDNIGLEAALRQLVEEWSVRAGIEAQYLSRGWRALQEANETRLPSGVESALYRVVQEALNNVQRHANATQVDVILEYAKSGASHRRILLTVADNGRGCDNETAQTDSKRLGLLGMKERIELIKGFIDIESSPAAGTTISVRVPLEVSENENFES